MMPMPEKQLLTRREAAEALRISVDTLARLIAAGELATIRIGRSVRIRQDEVAALVERRTISTRSEPSTGAQGQAS